MKLAKIIPLSISLTLLFPAFAKAAGEITTMSTSWQETTMTQKQCLRRAEIAVRDGGFSKGLEIVGQSSVFGDRGAYIATVRCATSKGMVFFVVAGPSGDRVSEFRNEIENNF